ncbi:MAG: transposase [Erysipelotrichia bacterium]|nr:transposase [Erysipelotrichia bacterium]
MNREYRTIPSKILKQPLEMLVYGTAGKPVMVFPSQEGRFFDYENFGMIDTLAPFIQSKKIQVYCVDSTDRESWFSQCNPADRARLANDYDMAVKTEIVPHIRQDGHENAGIMAHGCSFGAFHTANFALRHPDAFDSGIALSGCYSIKFAMHDFDNANVYNLDPLRYSADMAGKDIVKKLRENLLIVCSGQGPWEDWTEEATKMCSNLRDADIPVLLDLWGYDVNHDWPWWKKMIVYFLGKFDRAGFLHSNHCMTAEQSRDFLLNFHSI